MENKLSYRKVFYEGRNLKIFSVAESCQEISIVKEFSGNNIELRDPCWSAGREKSFDFMGYFGNF